MPKPGVLVLSALPQRSNASCSPYQRPRGALGVMSDEHEQTPREVLERCGFTPAECDAIEAHLRTQTGGEYIQDTYNAFAIAEGVYWWGSEWHSGQFSRGYRAMCGTEFRPGASQCELDREESHVSAIVYDWLVENVNG